MRISIPGLVVIICYVFVDDIIVYGKTEAKFLSNLKKALQRLIDFIIVLKVSKCQLGCPEITFL